MPRLTPVEVKQALARMNTRCNVVQIDFKNGSGGVAAEVPPPPAPHADAGGATPAPVHVDAARIRGPREGDTASAPVTGAARDAANIAVGYMLGMTMTVAGAAMALEGSDLIVRVLEGAAIGTFAIAVPVAIALVSEAVCRRLHA